MQSVFLPERFEIPNLLSYTDGDLQNVVSIRDVRLKLQGKKLNSLLSTAMTEESPLELVWNVKQKKRCYNNSNIALGRKWVSHDHHHQEVSGLELHTIGTKGTGITHVGRL